MRYSCISESACFPVSATRPLRSALSRLFALGSLVLAILCAPTAILLAQTPTPVTVPTWQYDLAHSGANTQETALTPANVNVNTFGKLFPLPVDGSVYAQPLYVPGLTMSDGQVHNVLFVATENDTMYAFDADSNVGANASPIWKVSLLDAAHGAGSGATAVPWQDTRSPDVAPSIGITGTPVINPATNTMYVVAATKENGVYFSRLHAINIITGAEHANSPVAITATVAGTGNGSSGGKLSFDPLWQNQRPALDYYNGYVYIGYSSHGDDEPWHGWLFAYNATTLAQSAVVCFSPNGYGSGIWSSGAGMPIDEDVPGGRMFVVTGNGTRTSGVKFPFSGSTGYGESVIDFHLANGGLMATDDFTAFNFSTLNKRDLDLASSGLLMPPDQQGEYPHILVAASKEGRTIVLNRDSLGGYAPGGTSNTNALQDIPGQTQGYWGTPTYWNGQVYMWGVSNVPDASGQAPVDVPKMFKLDDGILDVAPTSKSTITSAWPGSTFSISSNGDQDGIAWAVRSDQFNTNGPAVLYAWNANDLTDLLYESNANAKRDAAGPANKFAIPVVTNGKVYVATHGQVDVYGLFNNEPIAAAPVIAPNGGAFSTSQSVTLSTTTASADIYYTLDGSVPTPSSTLYSSPITISTTTTLNAVATASGYVQSGVSSATFSFPEVAPIPTFSPVAGTYTTAQSVTLSDADAEATIYYTTNGTTPTTSSTVYSTPIQVAATETLEAIAAEPNAPSSPTAIAAYTIQNGTPTINYGSGFSSSVGLSLVSSATVTGNLLQLTTPGVAASQGAAWFATPVAIGEFTTDFNFQLLNAKGGGITFVIQNAGRSAIGPGGSGLGYGASQPGGTGGMAKSVAIKFDVYNNDGEGTDSTGLYTNGASPTIPASDMTASEVTLRSGHVLHAHITYDGENLTLTLTDTVTLAAFSKTWAVNIPSAVGATTAYVGFTSSFGGGLSMTSDILNWTLSNAGP